MTSAAICYLLLAVARSLLPLTVAHPCYIYDICCRLLFAARCCSLAATCDCCTSLHTAALAL
eukprot:684186-Pelagomonas_calceolata.AAC.1